MKRTWFVDVEQMSSDGEELENCFDEVVAEAAAAAHLLNRVGGAVTIVAIQERTGEIPAGREGVPGTPLHRTVRFLFRYDSRVGATPQEVAEPAPEPEAELAAVEG